MAVGLPPLVDAIGIPSTCFVFAALGVPALIFIAAQVSATSRLSLGESEEQSSPEHS